MNQYIRGIIEALGLEAPVFECPPVGQTPGELIFGLNVIKILQPETIVEIGSGTGGHIYLMSAALDRRKRHRIVTIDPWLRNTKYYDQHKVYLSCSQLLRSHFTNIDYFCIRNRSQSRETLTRLRSLMSGLSFTVDFLFIDGSHEQADVIGDWLNYKDLVNRKGIMCFHDIVREPGVAAAWKVINTSLSSGYLTAEISRKGIPLLPGVDIEVELGLGYKYLNGLPQEPREFLNNAVANS